MLEQRWSDVEMLVEYVYEKVNSKDHSTCNLTKKMKLVGIFQGLSQNIDNTRFQ